MLSVTAVLPVFPDQCDIGNSPGLCVIVELEFQKQHVGILLQSVVVAFKDFIDLQFSGRVGSFVFFYCFFFLCKWKKKNLKTNEK